MKGTTAEKPVMTINCENHIIARLSFQWRVFACSMFCMIKNLSGIKVCRYRLVSNIHPATVNAISRIKDYL